MIYEYPKNPPAPDEVCGRKVCTKKGTFFNPWTGSFYCSDCAAIIEVSLLEVVRRYTPPFLREYPYEP